MTPKPLKRNRPIKANRSDLNRIESGRNLSENAYLRQVSIHLLEQTEEAKLVNLEPQIAKAHGVTSPKRDFV